MQTFPLFRFTQTWLLLTYTVSGTTLYDVSRYVQKRFQRLLQHAFNTLLNQMLGAFEQFVKYCYKGKECRKLVESALNQIYTKIWFYQRT